MSIQPRRPMLFALQEMLRKLESSTGRDTADSADLKRILRRRIADLEAIQKTLKDSKRMGSQV